jgi:biotin carboxylase
LIVCVKFAEELLCSVFKLDQDVILVRDNYDVAHELLPDDIQARLYEMYEVTSIDSIEELSAVWVDVQLKFPDQVRRVLSGAEYGMFAAGYLRVAFGLNPSEPELTIVGRDKRWMKQKFSDAGIPCARFVSNYQPGVPLEADFFPVVAKPVAGTGSFNTKVFHSKEELDAYVTSEQLHPALAARQWAVEEKIDGDEYHVDAVWVDGEIAFLSVGRYLVPRIEAMKQPARNGSVVLSPAEHRETYEMFKEHMRKFGNEVDFQAGITHAEFFWSGEEEDEAYLSEIATRFAGAVIPQVIEAAFGIDIIDAWLRAELNLEIVGIPGSDADFTCAGFLSITPDRSGVVSNVPSAEDYHAFDGVTYVRITTETGATYQHDSPSNWCVLLSMRARDEADFVTKCDELYKTLPVLL